MPQKPYTFMLADIAFEVVYKNVKTLRITVYPPAHSSGARDSRVIIAAPDRTEKEYIWKFAAEKISWVKKHRERFLNNSKLTGSLRNRSAVYVWGIAHELELVEKQGNQKIRIEDGRMIMQVRPGTTKAKREALLDSYYRRLLKETAPTIIRKWEGILNIEVKKLYVRKMKSHWGSCNYQKQTLRLNSELVKRKSECLEYVIVHEMLHIFEKGHNRNFYRLLSKYIPEWKTIRKKMNTGVI